MTSLAQDRRVAPHMARTTAVSSPRKSRPVTDATATPWSAGGLGGPLRTSRNCHSSQMGTTPKRGLKNHFEKLHNCALNTPKSL